MAESQGQQSGVQTISSGQNLVAALQQPNEGWNVANTAKGETLIFRAEQHSPFAISELYVISGAPNATTVMPLQPLIQGSRQRRPESTEYATAR